MKRLVFWSLLGAVTFGVAARCVLWYYTKDVKIVTPDDSWKRWKGEETKH